MWLEFELKYRADGGKHILIPVERIKSVVELADGCVIEYGTKEAEVRDRYKDVMDSLNRSSI